MDEIRNWPADDRSLDFIVATEPQFQPHLRQLVGSPLLDEGWRPSATNVEMIPDPSTQIVLVKKTLIQDYCMIGLLPYHPQAWIDRAATFLTLGYGDLAAADAYKAHLLCYAASVDELKVRKPGDGSLTARVFSAILSKLPQAENEPLEAYYLLISSSIERMHERAYLILAQGLLSMRAWNDAFAVLNEAIIAIPEK